MALAFVLLKVINIAGFIIVGVVALLLALLFKPKRESPLANNQENSPEEKKEETTDNLITAEPEMVPVPIDPHEYEVDPNDANLFINKKDNTIRIRRFKVSAKENKDQLYFTSNVPHSVVKSVASGLVATVPQLVKVKPIIATHEIELTKSSASKWEDIEDAILKFLFNHLHQMYGWKQEKHIVLTESFPNSHCLGFCLRQETRYHLDLGRRLVQIQGIEHDLVSEEFPSCMDHVGRYDFHLLKAKSYSWEELIPKIIEVFENYFPAGVEFKGEMAQQFSKKDTLATV